MDNLKIEQMECARIPTEYGEYRLCLYKNNQDEKDHLALVYGDVGGKHGVLVRVHSECFTGDVLGSRRCDCGEQLQQAMRLISEAGAGVIVYLRQEGRGIGLLDKLRAYNLQDIGYDTVEANLALGHGADERDYSIAALILKALGVRSVRLLTNNPEKIACLKASGFKVNERIALEGAVNDDNAYYLFTKAHRMNHLIDLVPLPVRTARKNGNGKNGSHSSMAV